MTASKLAKDLNDRELADILNDIGVEHEKGQLEDICVLKEFEQKLKSACSLSQGMAQVIAKEAALIEAATRWRRTYKAEQGQSHKASLSISKVSTMEGDEMQVMVLIDGKHIRLAMSLEDYAKVITGEAHIPVEVKRHRSKA